MTAAPVFLILTVIGDDRPGLVGELAAVISAHQGNWLESSMAQLAGKFAGIVEVGVDATHADALRLALHRRRFRRCRRTCPPAAPSRIPANCPDGR